MNPASMEQQRPRPPWPRALRHALQPKSRSLQHKSPSTQRASPSYLFLLGDRGHIEIVGSRLTRRVLPRLVSDQWSAAALATSRMSAPQPHLGRRRQALRQRGQRGRPARAQPPSAPAPSRQPEERRAAGLQEQQQGGWAAAPGSGCAGSSCRRAGPAAHKQPQQHTGSLLTHPAVGRLRRVFMSLPAAHQ
jgi:hypothetical protein